MIKLQNEASVDLPGPFLTGWRAPPDVTCGDGNGSRFVL